MVIWIVEMMWLSWLSGALNAPSIDKMYPDTFYNSCGQDCVEDVRGSTEKDIKNMKVSEQRHGRRRPHATHGEYDYLLRFDFRSIVNTIGGIHQETAESNGCRQM